MPKVKFFRHWTGERRVTVDDRIVGILKVERNGWAQHELKRGTPSQVWHFYPDPASHIRLNFVRATYYAEIKDALRAAIARATQS